MTIGQATSVKDLWTTIAKGLKDRVLLAVVNWKQGPSISPWRVDVKTDKKAICVWRFRGEPCGSVEFSAVRSIPFTSIETDTRPIDNAE